MIGNIVSSLGWLAFVQSNRNLSLSAFLKIVRYLNYFILQLFLKGLDIFGVFCFCFNDISVYFVHVSVELSYLKAISACADSAFLSDPGIPWVRMSVSMYKRFCRLN